MTEKEAIDSIKWFMHEHSHDKKLCDYLIDVLQEREKRNKRCVGCRHEYEQDYYNSICSDCSRHYIDKYVETTNT